MILYPAIDIRGGRAVRLVEGDYARETVYDADPVDAAIRWTESGAEWIHIVDLDGARDGRRTNRDAINRIRNAVNCHIQLGGGLRTMLDLHAVDELGVDRMVIGSAAVTDPDLVADAVTSFGSRIAVGLDARNGKLATNGWKDQTDIDVVDAALQFAGIGIEHVVFTDILRDGVMGGPNLEALEHMIRTVPANIIASGGISSLDDIRAVRNVGAAGVIIGSALYKRAFALADALACATDLGDETP